MVLCLRCRHTLRYRLRLSSPTSLRHVSASSSAANAPSATPPPFTQSSQPTAAVSSPNPGTSQPFSAPQFALASVTKANKPPRKGPRVSSKIPGGGELRGIGYTKAQPTVLAKEDDQYPQWLWRLLDQPKADGSQVSKVDVAGMTKGQRAKHDRKQERLRKTMPKAIPIHEHSADLTAPGDDAFVSADKRAELTKSARVARRKSIREENFLRSM